MGWSYEHKPAGVGTLAFLTQRINCENEHGTWKVLKGAIVGDVAYFAVERVIRPTGERNVFGAVVLIQRSRGRKAHEQWNFGWKELDESMGPFACECPAAILALLSPTTNLAALAWRASCVQEAQRRAAQKARLQALSAGETIRFERPMTWQLLGEKTVTTRTLQVVDLKRRLFQIAKRGYRHYLVSVPRKVLLDNPFTVVDAPVVLNQAA